MIKLSCHDTNINLLKQLYIEIFSNCHFFLQLGTKAPRHSGLGLHETSSAHREDVGSVRDTRPHAELSVCPDHRRDHDKNSGVPSGGPHAVLQQQGWGLLRAQEAHHWTGIYSWEHSRKMEKLEFYAEKTVAGSWLSCPINLHNAGTDSKTVVMVFEKKWKKRMC